MNDTTNDPLNDPIRLETNGTAALEPALRPITWRDQRNPASLGQTLRNGGTPLDLTDTARNILSDHDPLNDKTGSRDAQLAHRLSKPSPEGIGDRVRYDHSRKTWLIWNGVYWKPDQDDKRHHLITKTATRWWKHAESKEERNAINILMDVSKQNRVLEALASIPEIAMEGTEFDTDPNLLGVKNGVVDLRTGELRPGQPEDLITKTTRIDYVEDAECPRFRQFLNQITGSNPSLVDYLLLIFGAALFGHTDSQQFYVFIGSGNNGKGVLSNTIAHVFGDYGYDAPRSLYMQSKYGEGAASAARPDLIQLRGRRLAHMSEPSSGKFNEDLLKEHTGNDTITARDLYGRAIDIISWKPTHTIFFRTNLAPKLDDTNVSMQRRLRVVPFKEDFSDNPDRNLEKTLRKEAEGILRLLIEHAIRYGADPNLIDVRPTAVTDASEQYLEDSDPLARFRKDCCVNDPSAETPLQELLARYKEWHTEQKKYEPDLEELNSISLGRALVSNGFHRLTKKKLATYKGIALRKNDDQPDTDQTDFDPMDFDPSDTNDV